MGLRDRRRERQANQGSASGGQVRYQMRERLVSIGDDYWIEDDHGDRVFRVDGKALRLRKTLDFEDAHGTRLCRLQTRVMHIRDTMEIEGPDGDRLALVHKALITPFRERWKVDVPTGPDLEVHGNIVDHEYRIEVAGGPNVAVVSKKWFRIRDTYGVEIEANQDDVLILAVTVAVDTMAHPSK